MEVIYRTMAPRKKSRKATTVYRPYGVKTAEFFAPPTAVVPARTVSSQVKAAVRGLTEKKFLYLSDYVIVTDHTNPQLRDLSTITNGPGASSRIGNRVTPTGLEIRFQVALQGGTGADVCRVLVFLWRNDANTSPPAATDILASTGVGQAVVSGYNLSQRQNYKIIRDVTVPVSNTGNPIDSRVLSIPASSLNRLQFDGAAAFPSHGLYILTTCVNSAPGATALNTFFTSTLHFMDV